MRLTKFTHACVRVERDGAVLVIDPGGFTEPEAVEGADAVLITHEHFDHLDIDKLRAATGTTVYTHPGVAGKLHAIGGEVRTVEPGDAFVAAGFRVRASGGVHAEIHPDIPRVPNLGFLIEESVYHPGDSLDDLPDSRVETLLLPIAAPWLKLAEAVEFVRSVAPSHAYAIHDHLLSPAGATVFDRNLSNLAGCDYEHLVPGTTVELR